MMFVKNNHIYGQVRGCVLDIFDAEIEQDYMEQALRGEDKRQTAGFTLVRPPYAIDRDGDGIPDLLQRAAVGTAPASEAQPANQPDFSDDLREVLGQLWLNSRRSWKCALKDSDNYAVPASENSEKEMIIWRILPPIEKLTSAIRSARDQYNQYRWENQAVYMEAAAPQRKIHGANLRSRANKGRGNGIDYLRDLMATELRFSEEISLEPFISTDSQERVMSIAEVALWSLVKSRNLPIGWKKYLEDLTSRGIVSLVETYRYAWRNRVDSTKEQRIKFYRELAREVEGIDYLMDDFCDPERGLASIRRVPVLQWRILTRMNVIGAIIGSILLSLLSILYAIYQFFGMSNYWYDNFKEYIPKPKDILGRIRYRWNLILFKYIYPLFNSRDGTTYLILSAFLIVIVSVYVAYHSRTTSTPNAIAVAQQATSRPTLLPSLSPSSTPSKTPTERPSPTPIPSITATPIPSPIPTIVPTSIVPINGYESYEKAMIDRINLERDKLPEECSMLQQSEQLTLAARSHAQFMANRRSIIDLDTQRRNALVERNGYQRSKNANARMNVAGEGKFSASDADYWVNDWMVTEERVPFTHKFQMLDCSYKDIGAGLVVVNGTSYWTVIFGVSLQK